MYTSKLKLFWLFFYIMVLYMILLEKNNDTDNGKSSF